MANVPNIVRERLKAAAPAATHPDANVLTAFAEQSLPTAERAGVFDHLARCSDCRDVVALALPVAEDALVARVAPHKGWLTWPALRWALVAAGVVVIASFGVVRYREGAQSERMSRYAAQKVEVAKESPAPMSVPAASEPQAKRDSVPATPTRSESGSTSGAVAETKRLVDNKLTLADSPTKQMDRLSSLQTSANEIPGTVGGPVRRQISNGPNPPAQWQQQSAPPVRMVAPVPAPAANTPPGASTIANVGSPSQTAAVEVSGESQPVATTTQDQDSPAQSRDRESQQQYSTVGKAKAAVNVETASAGPVTDAAAQQELPRQDGNINGRKVALATTPALFPRWTISSAGSLQRSFDQGSTWQNVDVAADSAANLTGLEGVAKASRGKEKDAEKKALKAAMVSPMFRVVTAFGSDVWAGGSVGALYHSVDAGSHWTRVSPFAAGAYLSGDIVRLEFSDPMHGMITTSTAETWTTTDDGQTWQKQ